ncbi:MAG: PmoA family protein [Saprospiraceae bacterium]|nr:PmoA family protein [Saprospiraceae bacterium]
MFDTSPFAFIILYFFLACADTVQEEEHKYSINLNQDSSEISITGLEDYLILTQNASPDFRPYIHPLKSADGISTLTEYSPGHHKHQTGIYWGLTRVNGRDFFHHPESEYWRRVNLNILQDTGQVLSWSTQYEMLDSLQEVLMTETQIWTFQEKEGRYLLDLEWQGHAAQDVLIGAYDYGGLFVRMPWKEGTPAQVVNAARDRNQRAEGKRAMWLDLGMQVEGRSDMAHLTIFDHPQNGGYPQTWRVDGQFGVGPSRARMGDWQIPKGYTEIIRHRIEVSNAEATDVEINERWAAFAGNEGMYSTASLWGIAQDEGRQAKFLTPQEAVDEMTIKEGYQVNVWAAEPDITQPMAFCWDHKGRLWIAENRDYESRGSGFSNSGDSRILILEDTNHDGQADLRKVFMEGIAFPAAIAVGFDGLFLGAPPHLLFVPDKNHDDTAEIENIEVRLTGWGIRDRHETLNSFHWGPDGWLYGCQGFATPSKVRKPMGKERLYRFRDEFPSDLLEGEGTDINGGVWRYHPTKDRFEVVAHGFSNPWGIDYDEVGQLFISACVIPHLWHVIPGGIYQRQGGQHFNPYVYKDIQTIADHRHRSAHGGARVYLSDAFPEDQRGRIFMANIHEHAVLTDILERKGSGYSGSHGEDFLLANNAQWIGFSMEIGPDGGVYVLDWHDADICGKEVVNKETGRVFRIMPEVSQAENWGTRYSDLSTFDDLALADLQTNKSSWHSRRARLILQERANHKSISSEAISLLNRLLNSTDQTDHRLNALWTLHSCQMIDSETLLKLLNDQNEYIRAWSIQLLCEDFNPGNEALIKFEHLAAHDPSPVVRLYLAAALQRIDEANEYKILARLLSHPEDAADQNIPLMIWFALEPLVMKEPTAALELIHRSSLPIINQFVARRLVDGGKLDDLVHQINPSEKNVTDILQGILAALEGRTDIKAPAEWKNKWLTLKKGSNPIRELAANINQQFGDQEVIRNLLLSLKSDVESEQKRMAIRQLASRKQPELMAQLPLLLENDALQLEAIRAIAQYDHNPLGQLLLEKYPNLPAEVKTEAIQTLSSRSNYGQLLARAIADGSISKKDIPAYTARQLRRVVGSGFVEIWGPIEEPDANIAASYAHYRKLMSPNSSSADVTHGQKLFLTTCAPCHKMHGEGGIIGPELTGSNRTNLDYLLSNILQPSSEMQDDYRMIVITTRDGRTLAGNKIGETDRQITLRIVGQDELILNKTEIQSSEMTTVSMMPQGLLKTLSDQDVVNLLGYLMQPQI